MTPGKEPDGGGGSGGETVVGGRVDGRVDSVVDGIGPRLRDLRLRQGWSLQQLAERSGVSAAAIHKVEHNGMVPTITVLLKLAGAFDRPVSYFVDEDGADAGPVAFTAASARPELASPGPGVEVRSISGSYARFLLDGRVVTVAPGAGGGPSPRERGGEELVLVLAGSLRFVVGGRAHDVGPGDALHLRTNSHHRWDNVGDGPAQALWVTLKPL